jgi:glycogen debranching enzyme
MTGRYITLKRASSSSDERHWEHLPDAFGSVEDISDTLITKEQNEFFLTDRAGNVPAGNRRGLGLYARDTRYLSVYDFLLDGSPPLVLLSTADSGFTQEQVLGNHRKLQEEKVVGRCTVELNRQRVLHNGLEERLRLANFNPFEVTLVLSYRFDADFADIFEVRGHERETQGSLSQPEVDDRSICYRYLGADGVWRRTQIVFDVPPTEIDAHNAVYALTLAPRESRVLSLRVLLDEQTTSSSAEGLRRLHSEYATWHDDFAGIHSDNEVFNQVLNRSLTDLRMLWTRDNRGLSYFAAGTPWFATLFGRDSLIAALQTLPFRPQIAHDCLELLARHQGQSVDAYRAEEPGKILHEVREDELSVIGELPYQRYYGSVDSTPLFLVLAAEYFHWTADREFIEQLMPSIKAAIHWLHDYGDRDSNCFIEYDTNSESGLRNQGWKDSIEGIMHADGTLCEGPIALAEVQGYVYLAWRRLAAMFEALDEPAVADEFRGNAAMLRRRFQRTFWLREQERLAMALDGRGHPAEVMSSNAGQALWSGILDQRRATSVRNALFQNDMFSGWGIRTLSSEARSYYPLGYHVGTVWPHDNGIIALGLKRYGFDDEVNEIATALYDAAKQFPSYRLPELFGGQPRSPYQPPVPYPVACRPQAWTAGTMLHLLQAMLGMHPDAANRRLWLVRPKLPPWLSQIHIIDLPVGGELVNLHAEVRRGKTVVNVETSEGVSVQIASSWRPLSKG